MYLDRESWLAARHLHGVIEPRWEFQQALAKMAGQPRRVLDVGCGQGEFLHFAERAGHTGTGIDFNPASLAAARDIFGLTRLYRCSISELFQQHDLERFDAVAMFEVMEHIENPFATLCMVREAVRPGGYICISVPGLERFPALFDPQLDFPPHHLTLWTKKALSAIFERAGLSEIGVARKPLTPGDLGSHLKWRMQRFLSKARPKNPNKMRRPQTAAAPSSSGARTALWWMGNATLKPVCRLLNYAHRPGGFTLFASARRL